MRTFVKVGMASALALVTAAPAYAQYPPPPPDYRPTPDYQREYQDYRAQQQQYENNRETYREARRDYRVARRDYERRLAEWDRAHVIYDQRWGSGAYARMYPRPVWDESYWSSYEAPPYAGYYGSNAGYTNVRCDNDSTVAAGVIGALAGAVLGSNVAARNARTEGAVLGGVVGGAIGAGIGRARDRYRCDGRGPYFSYNETYPYRESRYYSDRYGSAYNSGYYTRQRCRLAPAPIDAYGRDYRYVRVCPDGSGRYRITG